MQRQDYNLPFMLQYENVAWYEDGRVRILDRRIYPKEVRFVECNSHGEVAQAITDMVTQSAGPYTAAGMGMALAAYEARELEVAEKIKFLRAASDRISNARPTTANRMRKITEDSVAVAIQAIENNLDPINAIFKNTVESLNRRYFTINKVAKHLCSLIPDNGKVLTQCFGETIIGMMLRTLKEDNKVASFYCCETRPYYQGARLTATCCSEMGFETTVISDNMVAYLMENVGIDLFTSAADTITRDGHVANKIGTFQIALLAREFDVPYFVTGIPDDDKFSRDDIKIELRDPALVLGDWTAKGVKAIYPSFDITPPKLIRGVVTDKGVYEPAELEHYFDNDVERFY
ncbi:s-methyl-5-thioribose-1-phosphate isomerase [Peptoniphilus asaccharolyticus]